MKNFVSTGENDTIHIASQWAASLPAKAVVFLEGDLGAGKSVFARALIRTLAKDMDLNVPSPTFTLLQTYDTENGPIWHYDLYRMKEPDEIHELSWDDALTHGLVLIEWSERLEYLKPEGITVKIEPVAGQPDHREISISA